MRRLEKINLIDRIGRELQERMSYADIDVYMAACDVDTSKETSNVNSKWVYVKEPVGRRTRCKSSRNRRRVRSRARLHCDARIK